MNAIVTRGLTKNMVALGLPAEAVVVPLVLSALVVWGGVAAFERRDLR